MDVEEVIAQIRLGNELRRMLVGSGVTQTDVAVQLGLTEPMLSKTLRGQRRMPEGFREQFLAALNAARQEKAQRLLAPVEEATCGGCAS